MQNFTLSKSFSQNTVSCGVPVVIRKNKGDVVKGLISYYNPNITRLYIPCPNNPSKQVGIDVPTNILIQKKSSFDGSDGETNTESTGNSKMVKNVIIGVVAVGIIYALYKIVKSN